MRKISMRKSSILVLALAGILATTGTALAEKPSWAGNGNKGGKHEQSERQDRHEDSNRQHDDRRSDDRGRDGDGGRRNTYFGDQHRNVIRGYYTEQYRSGHCPPGLVRSNNGCVPRGHARKWQVGRRLPREVIFYDLPPQVIVELGPPPAHHRFVRVASDILLIAVGTGMVVDAVQDLSQY
ncbi:MAG: RcnB family protein [Desulfobulbaceae bacterium]|nr:RcnB family protein [Desulfobulbaceae bacterium]